MCFGFPSCATLPAVDDLEEVRYRYAFADSPTDPGDARGFTVQVADKSVECHDVAVRIRPGNALICAGHAPGADRQEHFPG